MINKKKWYAKAEELYQVQLKKKYYADLEAKIAKELQALSDNDSFSYEEFSYKKVERSGAISYSSIPFLKEMDLEEYRRPGTIAWLLKKKVTASDLGEQRAMMNDALYWGACDNSALASYEAYLRVALKAQ